MKKILGFLLTIVALINSNEIIAQDNSIFTLGEKNNNTHNTGSVWLKEISTPDSVFEFGMAFASFAPNAKLDWHMHPGGQILIITNGIGYYQEKGMPRQVVRKGDIIKCAPNVLHWHGSTPNTGFSYIASSPSQKGKTIWKEPVDEKEYNVIDPSVPTANTLEQTIKDLSKKKWDWMSAKNADSLSVFFDEKCEFVHMGGTWGKEREVDIIKGGFIWYKKAEVYSTSVKFYGNTAIVLSDIDLVAVVGGKDAINPFMVTEVYVNEGGSWKLGQLTFSHLARPLKLPK